jgi:hypothetical protein
MVPQHGTRDDGNPPGGFGQFVSATGQFVTFCLLVGMATVIFGAVLLLPEYARLQQARYQLARQKANLADLQSLIKGNDRLIAALPENAVLTKRLAMNELGLWPEDEVVVINAHGPRLQSPAMVVTKAAPRPEPPVGWVMNAANRVAKPPTRRGLLLLAALGLVAAVILFPGAGEKKRKSAANPPGERA